MVVAAGSAETVAVLRAAVELRTGAAAVRRGWFYLPARWGNGALIQCVANPIVVITTAIITPRTSICIAVVVDVAWWRGSSAVILPARGMDTGVCTVEILILPIAIR